MEVAISGHLCHKWSSYILRLTKMCLAQQKSVRCATGALRLSRKGCLRQATRFLFSNKAWSPSCLSSGQSSGSGICRGYWWPAATKKNYKHEVSDSHRTWAEHTTILLLFYEHTLMDIQIIIWMSKPGSCCGWKLVNMWDTWGNINSHSLRQGNWFYALVL